MKHGVLLENILLGILLILIVMAALFESLLYPLSIMVSLVYSFVGVVWFLTLTGTPMTFMAMIGLMILIGCGEQRHCARGPHQQPAS